MFEVQETIDDTFTVGEIQRNISKFYEDKGIFVGSRFLQKVTDTIGEKKNNYFKDVFKQNSYDIVNREKLTIYLKGVYNSPLKQKERMRRLKELFNSYILDDYLKKVIEQLSLEQQVELRKVIKKIKLSLNQYETSVYYGHESYPLSEDKVEGYTVLHILRQLEFLQPYKNDWELDYSFYWNFEVNARRAGLLPSVEDEQGVYALISINPLEILTASETEYFNSCLKLDTEKCEHFYHPTLTVYAQAENVAIIKIFKQNYEGDDILIGRTFVIKPELGDFVFTTRYYGSKTLMSAYIPQIVKKYFGYKDSFESSRAVAFDNSDYKLYFDSDVKVWHKGSLDKRGLEEIIPSSKYLIKGFFGLTTQGEAIDDEDLISGFYENEERAQNSRCCYYCGCLHHIDDLTYIEDIDEEYCEECREDNAFYCNYYNKWFSDNNQEAYPEHDAYGYVSEKAVRNGHYVVLADGDAVALDSAFYCEDWDEWLHVDLIDGYYQHSDGGYYSYPETYDEDEEE